MTKSQGHFDCIVVGLGAMGSATLYHLARRGARVLGVEQFPLLHNRGSSHGRSRVFRTTYVDPLYVDLSIEALHLWRSLEKQSGRALLHLTGLLAFASRSNERFAAQLSTLQKMNLPHRVMGGHEATRMFNTFAFGAETVAFFAERNGVLLADQALRSMHDLARHHGAVVRHGTVVRGIEPMDGSVRVMVSDDSVTAGRVVVTAGPWLKSMCSDVSLPLIVSREQKVYFAVDQPKHYQFDRMPVFVEYDTATYGVPMHSSAGIKVAADHTGAAVEPKCVNRTVEPEYIDRLTTWVRRWMPNASPRLTEAAVCLYPNTPDLDFILDRHPQLRNVVIAGGFSGHGFKFSILIGDILADLAMEGTTTRPIERFQLERFT